MGIKGSFKKTISTFWPDAVSVVQLGKFAGKSVAIDMAGLLYFFVNLHGAEWIDRMREFFLQQIELDVDLVLVFEGKAGPEKYCEQKKRQSNRAKTVNSAIEEIGRLKKCIDELEMCIACDQDATEIIKTCQELVTKQKKVDRSTVAAVLGEEYAIEDDERIEYSNYKKMMKDEIAKLERRIRAPTTSDVKSCVELADQFGLVRITAPAEGDQICAWLAKNSHVEAVLSEDSDMIALGCPVTLTRVPKKLGTKKKTGDEWNLHLLDLIKVCELSGLSRQQITQWAILCGTDYNCNIPGTAIIGALDLIKKHGSFEKMELAGVRLQELQADANNPEANYWRKLEQYFVVEHYDEDELCKTVAAKIGTGQERMARIKQRRDLLEARWGSLKSNKKLRHF